MTHNKTIDSDGEDLRVVLQFTIFALPLVILR